MKAKLFIILTILTIFLCVGCCMDNIAIASGSPEMPTALAAISSFKAYEESGRVVVEWKTDSEIGTAGFHLMRKNEAKGGYFQVNEKLLPGLLVSPQGGTYRYVDNEARPGETYTYKLIEVEVRGKKRTYGPFTMTVGGPGIEFRKANKTKKVAKAISKLERKAEKEKNVGPSSREFMGSKKFDRKAHDVSEKKKARLEAAAELAREEFTAVEKEQAGNRAKIAVTEKGLYYLDASEISTLLGIPLEEVKGIIENKGLSLSNKGMTVAYVPPANNEGIHFYCDAIDSIYAAENIYWLEKGPGLTMERIEGESPEPATGYETFTETLHREEDHWALTGLFSDPETDYWLWDYFVAGYPDWESKSFTISTLGPAASGTALLKVHLQGATNTAHHVVLTLNGEGIGESKWDGIKAHTVNLYFHQALLNDGENTIEVKGLLDAGVPYTIFYLDSFDLAYQRYYQAVDDMLFVRGDGNPVVTIEGFTEPAIYLFDLSDPMKPQLINATTVDEQGDSNYRISFTPADQDRLYLALTVDASSTPVSVTADIPSTLKENSNQADYLVITPSELKEAALSLADYRQGQGLQAMVVELEDIMDEFNFGVFSPLAIRDFLSYAYGNWTKAPGYVVLVGEGTYDYKDNQEYGDNLMPPLMVSTPYGLFASDNRFADVEGDDGVPDMAIGRLPVATPEELKAVIEKIITYETADSADWNRRVLMAADNPDGAGNFPATSDEVARLLPSEYTEEKIYLSNYSLGDARRLIQEGINNGVLLLNYIGHGGLDRLAQEGMLLTSDVDNLANRRKYFVLNSMSCVVSQFAIPGYDSLSEALLVKGDSGAIAVWAATGLPYNSENKILDEEFFRAAFKDGEKILGEAVLRALERYSDLGSMPYTLDIYNVLGDPALLMR